MSALLEDPRTGYAGSVLILGSGVIGKAIGAGLEFEGMVPERSIDVRWNSPDRGDVLRSTVQDLSPAASNHAIVWAAGRAGFSADERACEHELSALIDVVDAIENGLDRHSLSISLHLVSSAGGLFEGRRRVSRGSPTTPLRPYGFLKREQEKVAMRLAGRVPVSIYRVSTVYSCPTPGERVGLVGQLIRNGLDRRPTAIYGTMDTLRDYVSSDEVGRFIAHRIARREVGPGAAEMLVAGRPTPISAVVNMVQNLLRRRLLISYREAWNARDITFDPAVRAAGFKTEEMLTGVSKALFRFVTGTELRSSVDTRHASI